MDLRLESNTNTGLGKPGFSGILVMKFLTGGKSRGRQSLWKSIKSELPKSLGRIPTGVEETVRSRINQKLAGDDSVYESDETVRQYYGRLGEYDFARGIDGWRRFKEDLGEETFFGILISQWCTGPKKSLLTPLEVVSWIDLAMYHNSYKALVSSEYLELETSGRIEEWVWLYNLHILYDRMWVITSQLRKILSEAELPFPVRYDVATHLMSNLSESMNPLLGNLRDLVGEMIEYIDAYIHQSA